jgi:hypothetical protein
LYFEKDGVEYKIESKGLPKQKIQFSSGKFVFVITTDLQTFKINNK